MLLTGIVTTFLFSCFVASSGYTVGIAVFSALVDPDFDTGHLALVVASLYTLIFFAFGKFAIAREGRVVLVRRVLVSWFLAIALVVWTVFLLKVNVSSLQAGLSGCFVLGLVIMPFFHIGLRRLTGLLTERGMICFQQIALLGLTDNDELRRVEAELARCGIFVAQTSLLSLSANERGRFLTRCREVTLEVQETLQRLRLDGIWIIAPMDEQRRLDELWAALAQVPLPIVHLPNRPAQHILQSSQIQVGQFLGYEVKRAALSRTERAIKRTMDIMIAIVGLVVLAPIFLITSVAILLETGRPVFFRQDRKGFGGKPFKILKFRSMRVLENGAIIRQAESSDPRVTPLGRFLRRTSIDELPQLINVLKGEMSIVGPRPHAIAHDNFYDRIIATYAFRHHVKPGITGWAQVNGFRGNTAQLSAMEGRVEADIWYINHWSPWLDIRIICRTALEVLSHEAAY